MDIRQRLHLSGMDSHAPELARKWGLGLEVTDFCYAPMLDDPATLPAVREKMAGIDHFWLHAPFAELAPCAVDPLVREVTARRYRQALSAARQLGIPLIMTLGTGNKLDPSLLRLADISETYGCPLARVMRKELRARGIRHLKVVFSPEEATKPASLEAPPPGRRSVPGSTPWVPATAGLLLGSAIVRDLIAGTAGKGETQC